MSIKRGAETARSTLQKSDFNVFRTGYAQQAASGFRPRQDCHPLRLIPPLDWSMDPFGDRNWCFQLHAWRMLQPIWSEFYGRDWVRLKEELLPWIRDWYRYHVEEGETSPFMWHDMATGLRAQHLALVVHLQQQGTIRLNEDENSEIGELVLLHIQKLRDPAFISRGNHGIFQLVGLRLLGIILEGRPEVDGEELYTSQLMERLIKYQFGPQGVHVENSPWYHNFAVKHFGRIRPALFPSIEDRMNRVLRQAREVATWFTLPNGLISAIGDSEGAGAPFGAERVQPDAFSLNGRGDRVLMRDLCRGGYAVVRTDHDVPPRRAEMLIVKGQASTTAHAHADQLGFELFTHGRPLLVDSGKFTYDRTVWRDYFSCDLAHNTVGLKGRVFTGADTDINTSGLVGAGMFGGEYRVQGQVSRRGTFGHRRWFRYRPGERLVLEDQVATLAGEVPVVYFHLAADVEARPYPSSVSLASGGKIVADLVYPADDFSIDLIQGQEIPYIQGWVSPSYGKRVPATVIQLTGRRPSLRFWRMEIVLREPGGHD